MARPISRRLRSGVAVLAVAGLAALVGPATAALSSVPAPLLTSISTTHYRSYDQLVFQFAGGMPTHQSASYVSHLPSDGSGSAVSVVGSALLLVSFSPAGGQGSGGSVAYGPTQRSYALPGVIQVVTVADHQNVIKFGVGLARREPFRMHVLAHSHQIIIDLRTPYRTLMIRDFFVDSRIVFGTAAIQAVDRPVIQPATPSAALQRLFAGPTQAELATGLRFVTSGATGITRLTIRDGVARVHLGGACSSGGATSTVATEIVPTLRQFPSVQWVKIYDPADHTEQPTGTTDSIPVCLKPSAAKVLTARYGGPVLIALVILAGVGILLGVVLSALSLLVGLALRPNLVTPSDYRDARIKARPVGTGQFAPDSAWPFYPLRQVRADLARIEADRRARYRKLWNWPFKPLIWILFLPVSAAALICLLVAGLTTVVLATLFVIITWTCAAATAALFAVTVMLLRGIESSWRTVMRTEASCPRPQCYHVTPWPAYRCPGCSKLHRDIRPGGLGLFARRCECGRLLPTMVLRAAWRLEAVCQRCGEPLRVGSAALRDVRIPIFGDTSAGKTRFLYAGLDSLIDTTSRAHLPFGFPDEESQNQATTALDLIRSGQDTVKTSLTLPTALTCRIGSGGRSALVHLFDAAGEHYRGGQLHDSLGFLDHGHGLVYVLDPFSLGSVRDRMTGQNAVAIRLAHAAAGDPETAYGEVVSRLRDSGVEAAAQRLAIVVSKADLLSAGGLELPAESAAIADWLMEAGVHNLVLSARRDFAEARYFAVASLAAAQTTRSRDPGAPLRWLLASRGVRLPADSDAARSPAASRSRNGPGQDDLVDAEQGETAKAQP
jgi:hypothetical protein